MNLWLDAQLPPAVATWICENFPVHSIAVRDLDLRDATDNEIFFAARKANSIVMTKDSDFIDLLSLYGSPPKIILLTCGNTTNLRLREILSSSLKKALQLLHSGESIVELSD